MTDRTRTRRWEGSPRKVAGEGINYGPGPEAASEMLCNLRDDARALRRGLKDMQTQNAESIRCQDKIARQLDRQHQQAESILEKANENTAALTAAIERLCEILERRDGDEPSP